MSLAKFCQRRVVTISPESNVVEACRVMRESNVGSLIVEEYAKLVGMLTDRDIALKVAGEGRDVYQTRVRDVMSPNPARISVDATLHDLTKHMRSCRVRRMPIVDGVEKPLGIVTLDDLVVLLGDEMWDMGKTVSEAFFRRAA